MSPQFGGSVAKQPKVFLLPWLSDNFWIITSSTNITKKTKALASEVIKVESGKYV